MAVSRVVILIAIAAAITTAHAQHDPLDYTIERKIEYVRHYLEGSELTPVTRVNLDLSLDGGATWHRRIAHGLPALMGTNDYTYSLRITPDLWTTNAVIGLRTLWHSTQHTPVPLYGHQSDPFLILGVRILSPAPGAIIANPSYMQLTYHQAGAATIDIGYRRDPADNWTHLVTVAPAAATNTWEIPIIGYDPGPIEWIISAGHTNDLYHTVLTTIANP